MRTMLSLPRKINRLSQQCGMFSRFTTKKALPMVQPTMRTFSVTDDSFMADELVIQEREELKEKPAEDH